MLFSTPNDIQQLFTSIFNFLFHILIPIWARSFAVEVENRAKIYEEKKYFIARITTK